MKVAFIGDRLGLATGGNLYVARVAEELAALGIEVTLITLVPPQDIPWSDNLRILSRNVEFSFGQRPGKGRIGPFFHSRLAAVTELKKLIREPYDILYSVGGSSNIVNYLCQKSPQAPRVSLAVIHHLFRQVPYRKFMISADTYRKPFQTFYQMLGDHFSKRFSIVTVSEFWREKLIARGFSKDKITIIPNGVDRQDWSAYSPEEAKKELNLSGLFVVYTSPLRLKKGIMNVLKASRSLIDRYPELMVIVTGVDNERTQKEVHSFINQYKMTDHFRYDGLIPRNRLPLYYAAADAVVLASVEEEGWGVTLLEGMMAGRPVICSPLGAMPELVKDKGIILKENTPQQLAQALEQLMENRELRDRLGKAGPPYAAQFNFQSAARAHLELFEELLGRT